MMEKVINFRKKIAFTVAETLIALTIIGAIAVLTTVSTIKSGVTQQHSLEVATKGFYSNLEQTYILDIGSIKNVEDSANLRDLFSSSMNGDSVACSTMGVQLDSGSSVAGYLKDAQCAYISSMVAGFYVDKTCETEVQVYEFRSSDNVNVKTVDDACGYIVYGKKGSKGILGYDVFTIALGKSKFKSK